MEKGGVAGEEMGGVRRKGEGWKGSGDRCVGLEAGGWTRRTGVMSGEGGGGQLVGNELGRWRRLAVEDGMGRWLGRGMGWGGKEMSGDE
jgi:hypothetical protein